MTNALATINNWNESQLALIQQQIAKDCTPEEISLFGQVCQRTGLDPFSRQIYAIKRGGKSPKMTIQVSIDGFRTLAERTGKYGGSTTYWCGADGRWVDVWLSDEYPAAAKTVVYRVGSDREFQSVALWAEMAQWEAVWKNGQPTNEKKLASLWGQMPAHMLGKTSEAHALRKAFPAELSGLYTTDEMPPATMEAEIIEPVTLLPDERQELLTRCSALFKQLGWGPTMRLKFLQTKFQVKSGEEMKLEQVQELAQLLETELAAKEPVDVA